MCTFVFYSYARTTFVLFRICYNRSFSVSPKTFKMITSLIRKTFCRLGSLMFKFCMTRKRFGMVMIPFICTLKCNKWWMLWDLERAQFQTVVNGNDLKLNRSIEYCQDLVSLGVLVVEGDAWSVPNLTSRQAWCSHQCLQSRFLFIIRGHVLIVLQKRINTCRIE